MAALEFSGGDFDPGSFGSFLGEQPDLGIKWAPRLVRLTSNLPMTATHKISKPTCAACCGTAKTRSTSAPARDIC